MWMDEWMNEWMSQWLNEWRRNDWVENDMIWDGYDEIWYDMMGYDMVWYDSIRKRKYGHLTFCSEHIKDKRWRKCKSFRLFTCLNFKYLLPWTLRKY